MRRSASDRALGVTTRPTVHRRSGLFLKTCRHLISAGLFVLSTGALTALLPARVGRLLLVLAGETLKSALLCYDGCCLVWPPRRRWSAFEPMLS
jgi:hypothetical protein